MTDVEKVTGTPAESSEDAAPATAPVKKNKSAKAPELSPYAVVETGGKQYRVSVGDRITIERLADDAGSEITLDRVLMLGGDGSTRIGTPVVEGAAVSATIDEHKRGEKIVVFKYKAKKRYRRKMGHRQELTRVTITGITG